MNVILIKALIPFIPVGMSLAGSLMLYLRVKNPYCLLQVIGTACLGSWHKSQEFVSQIFSLCCGDSCESDDLALRSVVRLTSLPWVVIICLGVGVHL
jgi:hypothetical protein